MVLRFDQGALDLPKNQQQANGSLAAYAAGWRIDKIKKTIAKERRGR
jgi:hypothetical protein